MKSFLVMIALMMCLPLAAQVSSYDELELESDSITSPYKPTSRNHVFIRSKRGTSGVAKSPRADSILTFPVTEIVLVYTEMDAAALEEREDANRERWDNLIMTYPEYFQFSTTYKGTLQYSKQADKEEAFKAVQGFYVYFTGQEPKAQPAAPVVKQAEVKKPVLEEKKSVEEKKTDTQAKMGAVGTVAAVVAVTTPAKGSAKEEVKEPAKEPVKEVVKEPVTQTKPVVTEEETPEPAPVVAKAPAKKKAPAAKGRKAKDPKACRNACYEGGDQDLNTFFQQNITLSKKQRKKAKKASVSVKLQLNVDGSIKKSMVTGENEVLNQIVLGSLSKMNSWNATVKNGVAIKSEVRITLKYDKETKNLKPSEVAVMPRLPVKCQCVSDSEMFD